MYFEKFRWPPCKPIKINNEEFNKFKEKQLTARIKEKRELLDLLKKTVLEVKEGKYFKELHGRKQDRTKLRKTYKKAQEKKKQIVEMLNQGQNQIQANDQIQQQAPVQENSYPDQQVQNILEIQGSQVIKENYEMKEKHKQNDYVEEMRALKTLFLQHQQQHAQDAQDREKLIDTIEKLQRQVTNLQSTIVQEQQYRLNQYTKQQEDEENYQFQEGFEDEYDDQEQDQEHEHDEDQNQAQVGVQRTTTQQEEIKQKMLREFVLHLLDNNYEIKYDYSEIIPNGFDDKDQYYTTFSKQLISESIEQIRKKLQSFEKLSQVECYKIRIKYNDRSNNLKIDYYDYVDQSLLNNAIVLIGEKWSPQFYFKLELLALKNVSLAFIEDQCRSGFTKKYLETQQTDLILLPVINIISIIRQYKSLVSFTFSNIFLKQHILNPFKQKDQFNQIGIDDQKNDNVLGKIKLMAKQLNKSQAETISYIVEQKHGICLIQGPPGTGKTETLASLVEAEFRYNKIHKIMICTPSNDSLDMIISKLQMKQRNKPDKLRLLRLGKSKRMNQDIESITLESMFPDKEQEDPQKIIKQKKEEVRKANVVFCTLNSAGSSFLNGNENQIDLLIVDEAAFAVEFDILIPLRLNPKKMVQIGDQQQLKPICMNDFAEGNQLNRSFFQRVLDNQIIPYFLDTCYRMHPEILELPNNLFYGGGIKSEFNFNSINVAQLTKYFEQRTIFYQIDGRDEKYGYSYYNQMEAQYILGLVNFIRKQSKVIGIGVVCAYRGQVEWLQKKSAQLMVEINTIDSFQGSESDIIIFSTVRTSNGSKLLADKNRINVALTRAKQFLFILGDIYTLKKFPTWQSILNNYESRDLIKNQNDLEELLNKKY